MGRFVMWSQNGFFFIKSEIFFEHVVAKKNYPAR